MPADFYEPWRPKALKDSTDPDFDTVSTIVSDKGVVLGTMLDPYAARAAVCVNVFEGIDDPYAELVRLRKIEAVAKGHAEVSPRCLHCGGPVCTIEGCCDHTEDCEVAEGRWVCSRACYDAVDA